MTEAHVALHLAIAVLYAFGAYQIAGRGHITEPLRAAIRAQSETIHYLIQCPMCSGFWYGIIYSATLVVAYPFNTLTGFLVGSLPFITSGGALLLSEILDTTVAVGDRARQERK